MQRPGTVGRRPRGAVHANAGDRERGFTLLEIVIVMAIIAAMAVLAAMTLTGGFERLKMQSASKSLVSNLRYTRAQAIASGSRQSFLIDPRGRTWSAAESRRGDISDALDIQFIGAREVQPREGVGAIVFFPDGASTGGRVRLISKRASTNVDVAWLTGEVTMRRGQDVR